MLVRSLFLILFSSIISVCNAQQHIVQFRISKPYALLNFIETANGDQRRSFTLRKFIETSVPKTDTAFYKLVSSFNRIRLQYSYKREEFPASRHQFRTTYDLVVIAAVKSETIKDFFSNSLGILPNSEHQKLFRLLSAAEPYYDSIIWNPYREKINHQLKTLEQYSRQANELFTLFKTFYNSSWSDEIPFSVALYPIPGKTGNTTATPHANSLCVGVLTDETNVAARLGVVLHEMCHVLYDEELSSFQHQLDGFFTGSKSPYKNTAYSFFDEALATALGNGWTFQYLQNRMDTTSWYNNKYIDGYAHALYPLITQYLSSKRTLDSEFIQRAIAIFGEKFPQSLTDYGILLNSMYLYTDMGDASQRQQISSTIARYFGSSRSNLSSPILHKFSIESMKNAKETQLIIVDRDHATTMEKLAEIFPAIKKYPAGKKGENYVLNFLDDNRRAVIIIRIDKIETLDKVIAILASKQYLDEANGYLPIVTQSEQ